MTDEQRYTQLLVDAICGVGFPSVILAQECERVGMAEMNDTGTGWVWHRKALIKLKPAVLQELYDGLCEQREENQKPTAELEDAPKIILQ